MTRMIIDLAFLHLHTVFASSGFCELTSGSDASLLYSSFLTKQVNRSGAITPNMYANWPFQGIPVLLVFTMRRSAQLSLSSSQAFNSLMASTAICVSSLAFPRLLP